MEKRQNWIYKAFDELTAAEVYSLLQLRSRVFVVEQKAAYLDLDDLDRTAYHIFLPDKAGNVVACCRVLRPGVIYAEASIGRVAVDPKMRGTGLGDALMRRALPWAQALFGDGPIHISAQKYLEGFYSRYGFVTVTGDYLEDGIWHVGMLLDGHPEKAASRLSVRSFGHSAFLVETHRRCLLFDYGERPARAEKGLMREGVFNPGELPDKPLYVFASHQHGDHYARGIHAFCANRPDTQFILGIDDETSCADCGINSSTTIFAWPHRIIELADLKIICSGSTDCGVSFLISAPEAVIYHGGDLALWDDDLFYRKVYRQEVDWLAQTAGEVGLDLSLAFLPVSTSDGYQDAPLLEGLSYFLDTMAPKMVIPMHGHGFEHLYEQFNHWAQALGFTQTSIFSKPGAVLTLDLS